MMIFPCMMIYDDVFPYITVGVDMQTVQRRARCDFQTLSLMLVPCGKVLAVSFCKNLLEKRN